MTAGAGLGFPPQLQWCRAWGVTALAMLVVSSSHSQGGLGHRWVTETGAGLREVVKGQQLHI